MNIFREYFKKYQQYWLPLSLVFILGIGIFFRTINYSDLLIFQSDQSRDALIIHKAIEGGVGNLPLIGPQARDSNLHLGPIFYYFQYISGKIFGESPEGFAYPDLFFGILTLPLLYLFLRKFVSRRLSLGVVLLASTSFFLVSFSRFAWNPNSLQFFSTFAAYSFLSALENTGKKRSWFLVGAALATGIILQLHFVAALSLFGGLFFFLIFSRALSIREAILACFLVLVVQTPTLIYEFQSDGSTARAFVETVDEKGTKDAGHSLYEKVFRAYQENASAFWLVATGQQNTETILTRGFSLKCDKECRGALPVTLFVYLIFTLAIVIFIATWKSCKNKEGGEKILFVGLWFISFLVVSILLAYQISTRFFLSITPIFFLIIALSIRRLLDIRRKYGIVGSHLLLCALIISNIYATTIYLRDLSKSKSSFAESKKDLVFGTEPKVTLGQLRYLASKTSDELIVGDPVFVSGESRYARSLYYLLSAEEGHRGCYMKGSVDVPILVNHVIVKKNKGRDDNSNSFGTLATSLDIVEGSDKSLPEGCLDY